MYRELNKKRIILERRRPFDSNVVEFMEELDMTDVIYTSAKLEGSLLTREIITEMMKGSFFPNVSLADHTKVQRYTEVVTELYSMAQMKMGISQSVISHIFERVIGVPQAELRDENPVIYEWDYNPPHPKKITTKLAMLVNWIDRDGEVYESMNPMETTDLQEEPSNFVLRAAYIHNRMLEIFPFKEGNAEIARFVMYYYLIGKGYPVFEIIMSDREYNEAIATYLNSGNIGPLYNGLMKSLTAKMDLLMTLTARN